MIPVVFIVLYVFFACSVALFVLYYVKRSWFYYEDSADSEYCLRKTKVRAILWSILSALIFFAALVCVLYLFDCVHAEKDLSGGLTGGIAIGFLIGAVFCIVWSTNWADFYEDLGYDIPYRDRFNLSRYTGLPLSIWMNIGMTIGFTINFLIA